MGREGWDLLRGLTRSLSSLRSQQGVSEHPGSSPGVLGRQGVSREVWESRVACTG